jgi:hypothetical protein
MGERAGSNWFNVSPVYAGRLLVPMDIICQIVSVSELTWFIRYKFIIETIGLLVVFSLAVA